MNPRKPRARDESENQLLYPHPCADDLDIQIIGLMRGGLPDSVISRKLSVSMRTVQRRIGRMMKETESPSRFSFGVNLHRMGVVCEPSSNSLRIAKEVLRNDAG